MSASTPRKRAPAKKAAPKAARTADERAEANLANFEAFRDRARGVRFNSARTDIAPYIIAADDLADGLKSDVVFRMPESLPERVAFTRISSMVRRGQSDVIPDLLAMLCGETDFYRILRAFDAAAPVGDKDAADQLLFGLAITVIEHFSGQGAADVPGGTTAS